MTVRHLLTQTPGWNEAIVSEAASTPVSPNVVLGALAQRPESAPGERFRYSQRVPDLLAYVVERAVGRDLQDYAQEMLFGPLGIERGEWRWLRDRAGNTLGFATLGLTPPHLARIGLMLQDEGRYNGRQVVPAEYVAALGRPSEANGCYGLMFWTNAGDSCVTSGVPYYTTVDHPAVPSAPRDMVAIYGALNQNAFVLPSHGITVVWTGLGAQPKPRGHDLLSSSFSQSFYHDFFRILMRGVRDAPMRDPGPFPGPAIDLGVDIEQFLDPAVFLADVNPAPGCSASSCPPDPAP